MVGRVSVPVVDIGKITSAGSTKKDFQDAGKEMVRGLHDCGFLYLSNHGVDQNVLDRLNSDATSFFNQDEKVKKKYNKIDLKGYQGIGAESLDEETREKRSAGSKAPLDAHRETFDFNRSEANAAFNNNIVEISTFTESFSEYYEEMIKLTKMVMKALEHGLGLPDESLVNLHRNLMADGKNNTSTARILFYPGIDDEEQVPEGSLRCGVHTDYGTCTFLFQDKVGGLEILNNKNVWQSAEPVEGVVLFNIGDNGETFTSGRLTARKHRVVIPKDKEHKKLSRRSYTFFVHGDNDVELRPYFPGPDERKYPSEGVTVLQFLRNRINDSRKHSY